MDLSHEPENHVSARLVRVLLLGLALIVGIICRCCLCNGGRDKVSRGDIATPRVGIYPAAGAGATPTIHNNTPVYPTTTPSSTGAAYQNGMPLPIPTPMSHALRPPAYDQVTALNMKQHSP